jgi:hypothetical protein
MFTKDLSSMGKAKGRGMSEALDKRHFLSIIAKMKKKWEGGKEEEYLAMDFIVSEIYREFIVKSKPSKDTKEGK